MTAETTSTLWACAVCGPHPGSRANWCDGGCGSDYQQMTKVPAETTLTAVAPFVERPCGACEDVGCDVCRTETRLPGVLDPETRVALTQAGRKVSEWTTKRDQLIRQAIAEGGSLREVGEAVGLSHTAVKFIAHGRKDRGTK